MKKKNKFNIHPIIGILLIIFGVTLSVKILVPMVLSILSIFLALLKLYPLLETNFKFIGGCFFLVVYWYIFGALASVIIKIIEWGYKFYSKMENKHKGETSQN